MTTDSPTSATLSTADWLDHISRQATSGQSASRYCRENGLKPHIFFYRKRNLQNGAEGRAAIGPRQEFIEVTSKRLLPSAKRSRIYPSSVSNPVSLEIPGLSLTFMELPCPDWIARLSQAVESKSTYLGRK